MQYTQYAKHAFEIISNVFKCNAIKCANQMV